MGRVVSGIGNAVGGLFGGGGKADNDQDQANQLAQEQINQNNADLEEKRQSLVDQRISIIKSEGAPNWVANRSSGYMS